MVRITGDFQQERVLHPAAMAQLNQSFAKGWADPNKLNTNSREVAILLQQVRENFATALKVRPDEIEFLGESGFDAVDFYCHIVFADAADFCDSFVRCAFQEQSGNDSIQLG